MKTTFRLPALLLLLVLAVLPGALRGSGPALAGNPSRPCPNPSGQLSVVEWSGLGSKEDDTFWKNFKRDCPDVEVTFHTQDSDQHIYDFIADLGNTADIIHPYSSWLKRWVDEGRVEEIDTSQLTNWDKVPDYLKRLGQFDDPQTGERKQYFVPWDIGLSSILYRTDKVEEKKGKGAKIDSWGALFDPDYEGHIEMFHDGPSAVSVWCYIHGYDEREITDDLLKKIGKDWSGQKELSRSYWHDEGQLINDMVNEDVWVAYAWPSAYDAVKTALEQKGIEVAYADPKGGRASWVGFYGILKGTKNTDRWDLALRFLDDKLSEETATNVVEQLHYAVANEDIMSKISDPTVKELFPIDVESVLKQTKYTPELTKERLDAWNEMWIEVAP